MLVRMYINYTLFINFLLLVYFNKILLIFNFQRLKFCKDWSKIEHLFVKSERKLSSCAVQSEQFPFISKFMLIYLRLVLIPKAFKVSLT
jgi:hypothetical protein